MVNILEHEQASCDVDNVLFLYAYMNPENDVHKGCASFSRQSLFLFFNFRNKHFVTLVSPICEFLY